MSVNWDPDQMDDGLQTKLKNGLTASYTPLTVASADSVEEAMKQAIGDAYKVFTVVEGAKSPGREVSGSKKQLLDPLAFTVVAIARNMRTLQSGRRGALKLMMSAARIVCDGATLPTCLGPCILIRMYLVRRSAGVVTYAAQFRTKAEAFVS
jgi:hypothetical protein